MVEKKRKQFEKLDFVLLSSPVRKFGLPLKKWATFRLILSQHLRKFVVAEKVTKKLAVYLVAKVQ